MTRKIYVFDTSALIYDPSAWKQFPHSDIVIPIAVLGELDKLKKQSGEIPGRNARVCIRLLDEISNLGDISTGILVEDDVVLKIDATWAQPDLDFGDPTYGDTHILMCLYRTYKDNPERDVSLVSNDINLRVKAKARSIDAISHEGSRFSLVDLYSGIQVIEDEEVGLELQQRTIIDPRAYGLKLNPHECVLFQSASGDGIAMGRKIAPDKLKVVKKNYPWGISARSAEQSFAIDLIMDKDIDLITLSGCAGTGKSLIALAAALELVISKREYDRLIIYRPIEVVGKDLGFLPGLLSEKLAPHFSAIMDNFEVLFNNKVGSDWKRDLEMFQRKGRIEMEAIAFIRGRSIPNSIMLIDEAQNLSSAEIKTILTRAGEGTKVILTGDIEQIDNEKLDISDNGLTNIIEKFKISEISAHMTLTKGERSRLATLSAKIL